MKAKFIVFAKALILLFCISVHHASAQVVVFSDLGVFANDSVAAGGIASGISRVIAEKITLIPGAAGMDFTTVKFSVANLNSSSVSVRPRVRFWLDNGSGGGPGTLLNAFSFSPITFAGDSVTAHTFNPTAGQLVVPAGGTLWAGIQFDNAAGATATAAQVDNFGAGLYSGVSVGSSDDSYWRSASAANQALNNPTGSFGTNPTGTNFGWEFQVATAVPEPSTYALCAGVAALGFVTVQGRFRKK